MGYTDAELEGLVASVLDALDDDPGPELDGDGIHSVEFHETPQDAFHGLKDKYRCK